MQFDPVAVGQGATFVVCKWRVLPRFFVTLRERVKLGRAAIIGAAEADSDAVATALQPGGRLGIRCKRRRCGDGHHRQHEQPESDLHGVSPTRPRI
jgi:hypothetical protein